MESFIEFSFPPGRRFSARAVLYSLYYLFRQYRIILSADTASEVRQLLSQKRR